MGTLHSAAADYHLGASGVADVIGLWSEQGTTDELVAIIRSANASVLTAAHTIATAQFP